MAVTLAATSVAGIVVDSFCVIYLNSVDRGIGCIYRQPTPVDWPFWFVMTAVLSLPVIIFTVKFSNDPNPGDLRPRFSMIGQLIVQRLVVLGFKRAIDSSSGVGWPDLISSVFPWGPKTFIGRGRALKKAWVSNCATPETPTLSAVEQMERRCDQ